MIIYGGDTQNVALCCLNGTPQFKSLVVYKKGFWDCLLRAKEEVQCLAHDFLKEIFTGSGAGDPPADSLKMEVFFLGTWMVIPNKTKETSGEH